MENVESQTSDGDGRGWRGARSNQHKYSPAAANDVLHVNRCTGSLHFVRALFTWTSFVQIINYSSIVLNKTGYAHRVLETAHKEGGLLI